MVYLAREVKPDVVLDGVKTLLLLLLGVVNRLDEEAPGVAIGDIIKRRR